jgi:hypothetical protein
MKLRLARALLGLPVLASIALLSPASGNTPQYAVAAGANSPTPLDYVVLASLADVSNLLSLSTYDRASNKPATVGAVPVSDFSSID